MNLNSVKNRVIRVIRGQICGLLLLLLAGCSGNTSFENAVKTAVCKQMTDYPESRLRDLYKNFFQDCFGPGHLISDTAAAANYLRSELASFDVASGVDYEPSGWQGNFYRVNLSVVKDGRVSFATLLDAFTRSANSVVQPSPEEWKAKWAEIEAVIKRLPQLPPNFAADSREIAELLAQGKYALHHSDAYNAKYSPHYRIVAKDVFERELLPLIKNKGAN